MLTYIKLYIWRSDIINIGFILEIIISKANFHSTLILKMNYWTIKTRVLVIKTLKIVLYIFFEKAVMDFLYLTT